MRVNKSDLDDAVVEDAEAVVILKSDTQTVTAKSKGKSRKRTPCMIQLDAMFVCERQGDNFRVFIFIFIILFSH